MPGTKRQQPLTGALESAKNKIKRAAENLACPFATKIVKDIAGVTTFQDDAGEDGEQLIFLPPNTTMRGMWLDWVRGRGWDPIKTCKSKQSFKKIDEWMRPPEFYETEEEADDAEPVELPDGTLVEP